MTTRSFFRRRVTLRQLELLAAFERAPNLSLAARAVNLSQPAASKLLSALAADLGIQLFERAGRELRPTEAGRALVRRAARFLGDLDRTHAELTSIQAGLSGSITVGAGFGACYALVPRAFGLLLSQAPNITIGLREGPISELMALLRDRRIDLLVGRVDPALIGDDLKAEELYDPPMRIVGSCAHPLARLRRVDWPQLLAQEWILPERSTPTRSAIERAFQKCGARPERCRIESSSIQANVAMLGARPLLWPVSADIATALAKSGALCVLRTPRLPRSGALMMIYCRDAELSPLATRLGECFRNTGQRLRSLFR